MLIYHQLRDYEPLIHDLYRVASSPKGRAPRVPQYWTNLLSPTTLHVKDKSPLSHASVVEYYAGISATRIFVFVFSLPVFAGLIGWSAATDRPDLVVLSLACLTLPFILINLTILDRTFWAMRRLHDLGLPGFLAFAPQLMLMATLGLTAIALRQLSTIAIFWLCLGIAAQFLVSMAYLVLLYCVPGQSGPNRYGPEPDPLRLPEDLDAAV
ncbi:MAG: DUF805 domain-containing protein [Oceanicaulis sp.]|nr:DUF805 domain-containing protein [Oceanicaulis sp.]